MKTHDKILIESLKLFAIKGYSDVFLNDIAENVGIKAPSIYKHFKNKKDIFESCIEKFEERMNEKRLQLLLPINNEKLDPYLLKGREEIIDIALKLLEFHLTDDVASNFRKMLLIERSRSSEINSIYEKTFITNPLFYQENVFKMLINENKFKKGDSKLMALKFYSPIYFILQKYDFERGSLKNAKDELTKIIIDFCNEYEVSNKKND
ncbi:TetR/AcrR family transcriptional regulator [Fundicoccus ignavus]|uniref:TetR family transcriptional regulator n=1 Tax=Fundicoccus ignavus TaxID=2664442 RepID=A0A844C1V7_9LACT|nr:TetR/AcrR family transcriptional regulator [Fundicoccus ignavus]MRJ48219.1 TetR family transcriptional regulator [Fundicoccus ignavus]